MGTLWGQGGLKVWGILGTKSPKIVEFRVGDRDKNFGEFANSNLNPFKKLEKVQDASSSYRVGFALSK